MIMADSKKIQKEEVNEDLKAEDNKKKSKKEQNYKEELKKKEEEFNKKIEEVEGKLAKEKDDYVRLMAEFETFRRRSSEDRLNLISSAAADTIKGLLPVLDDCERAMEILENLQTKRQRKGLHSYIPSLWTISRPEVLQR